MTKPRNCVTIDWKRIRAEFPALANWTFLNTATYGQLPRRATEAAARHFTRRDELACWDFLDWFDDANHLRRRLAILIRCQPEDIAFITNAASGLALLMSGVDWRAGDCILTLEDEFPNNIYYPGHLARRGIESVEAPWERFRASITPRTRLVILSSVRYTDGFRPPLEEIAALCRTHNALLYVDGTQSVGALTFDVARIRPHMLVVHGYKWMLAPNGAAFMYVAPEVREWLEPQVIGWRSHTAWRQVDNLHHGAPEFVSSAEKYEGGGLNFPSLYAMDASVEMILDIGVENIERRALGLAAKCREVLCRLGARPVAGDSAHYDSPIVAAHFEGKDASAMARALKEERVLVSARHGNLRVSTHFYNDEEDLARLEAELRRLLG